nr:IS66 family transposase [Pseudomonas sp. NFACC02]
MNRLTHGRKGFHASHRPVAYDFSPSRAGEHARYFLGNWNGKLVCDDFAGYKADPISAHEWA